VYPDTLTEAKLQPRPPPATGAPTRSSRCGRNGWTINIRITGADPGVLRLHTWGDRPFQGDPKTGEPNPGLVETTGLKRVRPSTTRPPNDWYYLLARCRIDPGPTATSAGYFHEQPSTRRSAGATRAQ